jgi:hypothetical protein
VTAGQPAISLKIGCMIDKAGFTTFQKLFQLIRLGHPHVVGTMITMGHLERRTINITARIH